MIRRTLSVIGVLGVVFGISYFFMKNQVNQRNYVDLSVRDPEVLVFYKDTCPTCQKMYPKIYIKSLSRLKVAQFVNMDAKKNHQYIKEYKLKKVPTVINTKTKLRYAGVDLRKIDQVIISSNKNKIHH